jgi:hypothetical protein
MVISIRLLRTVTGAISDGGKPCERRISAAAS